MTTAPTLNATKDQFEIENDFYRTTKAHRLGKLLAQFDAFKRTIDLPGAIVECGVFKGSSLYRLAMLRALFCGSPHAKQLIAFDTFESYAEPDTFNARDWHLRKNLIREAGDVCASQKEIMGVLREKGCDENVSLVRGLVEETIPEYVQLHPELRISFLNLDLDFYPGSKAVLEHLWPRVVRGGVMLLDDYGVFEGETRAVDEAGLAPMKLPYCYSPSYVVKP